MSSIRLSVLVVEGDCKSTEFCIELLTFGSVNFRTRTFPVVVNILM